GPQEQSDVAALRSAQGVADAYVTNSVPLTNSGGSVAMRLKADQVRPTTMAAIYFAGGDGVRTLDLHLIAGRDFAPDEIGDFDPTRISQVRVPGAIIVTQALADRLFPGGNALGRAVFLFPGAAKSSRIVGIVHRLQVPWTSSSGWGSAFSENSVLVPARIVNNDVIYAVRARPGQLAVAQRSAMQVLRSNDRMRILDGPHTMTHARRYAYRDELGFSVFLAVVTWCLLGVTAAGIVGLTTYWVSRRKRQIGIRRALGATRGEIVWYFLGENLLIAAAGVAAGAALTMGLNLWITSAFAMPRMPLWYLAAGICSLVLLGQLAALWPAWRAASIPPAIAARSA
ncbi:MAG TPA: FtsX-like permease family protein, partial [Steroidobacteraceae bacterium]|nr:FtsX-like permease family protein [Steroidobacteraceae bacterium]